jgi:hypothetical protein
MARRGSVYRALTIKFYPVRSRNSRFGDEVMVAAVSGAVNALASAASKPSTPSKPSSVTQAFQQSLNQYLKNTTSGAGGASGANPSQSLSSDLMSTLLQMQG